MIDFEIPKRYGLRQTIGDTLGIGGIMRALRTIPVMLDLRADMEEVCPDVLFLNYTNPMAMLCMAMNRATAIRTVGLCHSVQGTAEDIAGLARRAPSTRSTTSAPGSITSPSFCASSATAKISIRPCASSPPSGASRPGSGCASSCLRRFGYFVTESSEHFSEYVPWFIKPGRDDLIQTATTSRLTSIRPAARTRSPIGPTSAPPSPRPTRRPCPATGRRDGAACMGWTRGASPGREGRSRPGRCNARGSARGTSTKTESGHSGEYGTLIIHSVETGQERVVYGNVANRDSIANLPASCCVEVPCLVDRNGVQPTMVGTLPPQLAALMQTNINVQELTVDGALTGKREHVYQAAMLDPHTAAELDPEQICALVDDLLEAHGSMIPQMA